MQDQWYGLEHIQTQQLQNNLQALAVVDPELLAFLQQHKNVEPLLFQKHGNLIRCKTDEDSPIWLFGENDPVQEQKNIAQQVHRINREAGLYIFAGNAAGYAYAVIQPFMRNQPEKKMLIHEPNASRLWAMLSLLDISQEIMQSQIYLADGEMNEDGVLEAIAKYGLWNHSAIDVYTAPETKTELTLEALQNKYQQENEQHKQTRNIQLEQIKQSQSSNVVQRVLLVDCWVGKPGSVHLQSIDAALQKRNVRTQVLPLNYQRINWHSQEYKSINDNLFINTLHTFQPDMVLSFGYHAPEFVRQDVYEASNAKWVQVVTNLAYQPKEYFPNECPILVEEKLLPAFQKKGMKNSICLPLAANKIAPEPIVSNKNIPIVFVGNSFAMLPHDLKEFQQRIKGRELLQQYCMQAENELSQFDAGLNLFSYLEDHAPPQIEQEDDEYHLFRYLLSQATARCRIHVLESIANKGLLLFGGDWDRALPANSPLRNAFKHYADENVKHQLSQQGYIFLNIHSAGNATCPNMRFFNTPGEGSFQISDQTQFSSFFESGTENVFYSSVSELHEKIDYFLAHPNEADEIRLAGYEKVKSHWTYEQWIEKAFSELDVEFPKSSL